MKHPQRNVRTFQTREELAGNLADKITILLGDAITARQKAVLVVSGGSTPRPLFEKLARKAIPWDRVTVTLADERWVDPTDPESNENLVRTHLLQDRAKAANFEGLKNNCPTAAAGEKICRKRLAQLPLPFDVVVLGMGSDGHTASLFPGTPLLKQALARRSPLNCLAVSGQGTVYDRMTMTLSILLEARQIFLHITGKEKMTVLEQALAGGPAEEMPIRAVLLQKKTPVQIYWAP